MSQTGAAHNRAAVKFNPGDKVRVKSAPDQLRHFVGMEGVVRRSPRVLLLNVCFGGDVVVGFYPDELEVTP